MSEWYGTLPERWERTRIKNIFALRDERNFASMDNVRLISLYTHLGVLPHDQIEKTTGNKATTVENYKIVHSGDIVVNIILCWQGAVGLSHWNGVTSPAYDIYRPKTDRVCGKYFHYLFRLPQFSGECYRYGRGIMAMRWRTYSNEFSAITVPFPPCEEQDQIVRYLDWKVSQVNRLINAKKKQIGLLQEQKRAVINAAVTKSGLPTRIKDVCEIITGTTPKSGISEYWDGDINWITPADINSAVIIGSVRKITEKAVKETSLRLVPKGSVIFTSRAPIGKVAITEIDLYCNQGFKNLVCSNKVYNRYLYFWLLVNAEYLNAMGSGTTFTEISKSALGDIQLPLPPFEEQQSIVAELDDKCAVLDRLTDKITAEITLLHEYRTRLISDVVTGKLDVRGVAVPEFDAVEEAAEEDETQGEDEPTDTEEE